MACLEHPTYQVAFRSVFRRKIRRKVRQIVLVMLGHWRTLHRAYRICWAVNHRVNTSCSISLICSYRMDSPRDILSSPASAVYSSRIFFVQQAFQLLLLLGLLYTGCDRVGGVSFGWTVGMLNYDCDLPSLTT